MAGFLSQPPGSGVSVGRVMGEDVFEAVVGAHHAEIRRYLLRVTARASDADDLSQETFLRAFRAYRALPAGADVRAWLFTIATNLGRNHFRAQSRRRRAYAAAALGAGGGGGGGAGGPGAAGRGGGPGAGRRGPGADRAGDQGASGEAAAGVHHEKDARAPVRGHRREPQVLGGERARPRLPGAAKGPAGPRRSSSDGDGVSTMSELADSWREI